MLKDFRDFAMRGNVIDLAVAVIIGIAFGKIVASLVKDIIMPPIGLLLGGVDFSDIFINLSDRSFASLAEAQQAGAPTINVGVFLNTVLEFLIVAFAVFLVVRGIQRLKKAPPPADPTTRDCPYCLMTVPVRATRCGHCTSEIRA